MTARPDPSLFPYADHVLDRIEQEPEFAKAIRAALETGETLVLDFHPHAEGGGWCAAIRVERDRRELVHLRGIVRGREECGPMGVVLAGLLTARHRLPSPPAVFVEGVPVFG
jgi:hypothetical protein